MQLNVKAVYNLNNREKAIIGITILFSVGYLIYQLLIPGVFTQYRVARKQFLSQRVLIKTKQEKTEYLLNLEQKFEYLQSEISKQQGLFFSEQELTGFLNNLEKEALATDNDIKTIRPSKTEIMHDFFPDPNIQLVYKKDIILVKIQGKYNNLLNYFKKLKSYQKLLGINKLDIKCAEKGSGKLEARFLLNVYYVIHESTNN